MTTRSSIDRSISRSLVISISHPHPTFSHHTKNLGLVLHVMFPFGASIFGLLISFFLKKRTTWPPEVTEVLGQKKIWIRLWRERILSQDSQDYLLVYPLVNQHVAMDSGHICKRFIPIEILPASQCLITKRCEVYVHIHIHIHIHVYKVIFHIL